MSVVPFLGVVVIGHVNHGKTALVRALTGVETDRLPEEKVRGMSIALGFAWCAYPEGGVDFLDAPGHEDFIRAMVMGAAGARTAMLVVSASEGVGRQTLEHLRIAGLLGLEACLVAVTKADLVPEPQRPALETRLRAELAGLVADTAPYVFCSAQSGEGLEALHSALRLEASQSPPPATLPGALLPLDRVFTLPGAGTVVTGSLQGGALTTGAEAVLQPSGRRVHLRQLQVHGQPVTSARAGDRVAAALRGVSAGEVEVGEVLCTSGDLGPSSRVDLLLRVAPGAARPLRSGDEVKVLWGARQDMARVRLLEATGLEPGREGLAQLRFPAPVPAFTGQRLILRRPSPAETLAGGEVLDPLAPVLRARTLHARRRLLAAAAGGDLEGIADALAERDGGVVSLPETRRLSRRPSREVEAWLENTRRRLGADLFATEAALESASRTYLDSLAEAHQAQPARAYVSLGAHRARLSRSLAADLVAHVEARLLASGALRIERGQVALADHDPFAALSPDDTARLARIEAAFLSGGVTPPDPSDFEAGLVDLLIGSGRMTALRNHALRQTLVFHLDALDAALEILEARFPPPSEFTTGEARAALSTSRKFIVPVLEFLDARGDTIRRGDLRQVLRSRNRFGPPPVPL